MDSVSDLTFGSLFAGIGGFDLGFSRAGMVCKWQAEKDKNCLALLDRRFPDVPKTKDVRNVTKDSHESVDLICGGFPCQDLSIAGRRQGLDGKRSGFWFEFHRIIGELKPGWVVIENVPGLLSSNGGRDFAVILRGLAEFGYYAAWRVLDAQYYGLAQRRKRVFIVASLGTGRAAQVLFECEGGAWLPPPSRGKRPELATDVAAMLKGGSGQRGFPLDRESGLVAFAQNTRDELRVINGDGKIAGAIAAQPGMKQQTFLAFSGNNTSGPLSVATSLTAHGNRYDFKSETFVTNDFTSKGLPMSTRIEVGEICSTLDSQSGPNRGGSEGKKVLTGNGVRRLMPIECERLQGFPDGWTDGQSDSVRYRQLGNAVALPVAEWLARRIVKIADEPEIDGAGE